MNGSNEFAMYAKLMELEDSLIRNTNIAASGFDATAKCLKNHAKSINAICIFGTLGIWACYFGFKNVRKRFNKMQAEIDALKEQGSDKELDILK